jgi:hypothetical protein
MRPIIPTIATTQFAIARSAPTINVSVNGNIFTSQTKTYSILDLSAFLKEHYRSNVDVQIWKVTNSPIELTGNVVSIENRDSVKQDVKCVDPIHNYLWVDNCDTVSCRFNIITLGSDRIFVRDSYNEMIVLNNSYAYDHVLYWKCNEDYNIYDGHDVPCCADKLIITNTKLPKITTLYAQNVEIISAIVGKVIVSPVGRCAFRANYASWKHNCVQRHR